MWCRRIPRYEHWQQKAEAGADHAELHVYVYCLGQTCNVSFILCPALGSVCTSVRACVACMLDTVITSPSRPSPLGSAVNL